MKLILIITSIIIFSSCIRNQPDKGYVDEDFALINIKKGMTRLEVVNKIGLPKDSVIMINHENVYRKIYTYETNNFSGYSLNIVFNSKDIVDMINMD